MITRPMHASVIAMARYPVKGLAGTPLSEADLRPGHGIVGDRRFDLPTRDASSVT